MIAYGLLFGSLLAAGLLLLLSPWWWPRTARPAQRTPSWLRTTLVRAGFERLSGARFLWIAVASAALIGSLLLAITGIPVVAALGTVAGAGAPLIWLNRRAAVRRQQLAAVWPDVVDHLIGALRAGLGLPDALAALAESGPVAVRPVFAQFADDYRRSGSWALALDRLKYRCADPTADRLCETLRLAREVGGTELVPVLKAFGGYLREDAATTAELRARQSWITNAARLGVVAPWIVLVLLSFRPEARVAYNSPTGVTIILIGAVLSIVAYQLMRRIARFRPEPRWAS